MKKLFLTLGLASLFMVACNNTPKQQEQPAEQPAETTEVAEEEHNCPMHDLKAAYADWDNMTDETKAQLNAKAVALFAEMDAKMEEMKAEGKECCKESKEACEKKCAEMTEEQKAECEAKKAECEKHCAEMKAKWDNFANLSIDEQKDLIMERLNCCGGEKKCCKDEAPKCEENPAE